MKEPQADQADTVQANAAQVSDATLKIKFSLGRLLVSAAMMAIALGLFRLMFYEDVVPGWKLLAFGGGSVLFCAAIGNMFGRALEFACVAVCVLLVLVFFLPATNTARE